MFTSGIITLPCVEIEFCKINGVLRTLRDQVYLICKNSKAEYLDALFKITSERSPFHTHPLDLVKYVDLKKQLTHQDMTGKPNSISLKNSKIHVRFDLRLILLNQVKSRNMHVPLFCKVDCPKLRNISVYLLQYSILIRFLCPFY